MFGIHDRGYQLCDGLTRREWLRVGGLGLFGLSLPALLQTRRASAAAPVVRPSGGKAKACIVLFLAGGPPQHETWDPKPDADVKIRGEFKPIASSVPGLRVGELMPRIARLADRCCVLRAVSTNDHSHGSSYHWALTGIPHSPGNTEQVKPGAPNDWPGFPAVVRHLRAGTGSLPAAITLPERMIGNDFTVMLGQDAGFLGRAADPWLLTCDPAAPGFDLPALGLPAEVPPLRFDERRSLLEQVNRHLDGVDRAGTSRLYAAQSQQAFDLLRSRQARLAFDLEREPPAVRDRYGRHKFGQSVLLARRLIEAGVALVQVNWPRERGDMTTNNPCWDTHSKNSDRLKTALMPPWDLAFSALLEDLSARGMLDETLVVSMGEFGRTPKINDGGGRDHWGGVFSLALAGGGVRGGQVIGASDANGAHPKDGRALPQDVIATLYHCLGYSPDTEMHDRLGRPVPISRGQVIRQALGG
jgi:hypothetical protein